MKECCLLLLEVNINVLEHDLHPFINLDRHLVVGALREMMVMVMVMMMTTTTTMIMMMIMMIMRVHKHAQINVLASPHAPPHTHIPDPPPRETFPIQIRADVGKVASAQHVRQYARACSKDSRPYTQYCTLLI